MDPRKNGASTYGRGNYALEYGPATNQKHLISQGRDAPVGPDDGVGFPQRVRHVLAALHADLLAGRLDGTVPRAPERLAVLLEADTTYAWKQLPLTKSLSSLYP